jgi:hypothetical protein
MTAHSPLELARMVELSEAAAYADLLRAAPASWRCTAEETDAGWLLIAPTLDMLLFNRLVGAGLGSAAVRQRDVARLLARFDVAKVRNFGVQLSPSAEPLFRDALATAGLVRRDRWTKVYRDAEATDETPAGLRVELLGAGQADLFATVTTGGFGFPQSLRPWIASTVGRPGWRHYVAYSADTPLAAAALFQHGDVGWLGVASTLPDARRRGAQGALMRRRIEDGREAGCRWFVTETGEDIPERPNPSFRNMMRAGFQVAYHRPNFMLPA